MVWEFTIAGILLSWRAVATYIPALESIIALPCINLVRTSIPILNSVTLCMRSVTIWLPTLYVPWKYRPKMEVPSAWLKYTGSINCRYARPKLIKTVADNELQARATSIQPQEEHADKHSDPVHERATIIITVDYFYKAGVETWIIITREHPN
jgi:hypothetical protein